MSRQKIEQKFFENFFHEVLPRIWPNSVRELKM